MFDSSFLWKDTSNLVIIGNGISRLNYPVENVIYHDCLVGACNAWYRDHENYIVGMVDTRMVSEVLLSGRGNKNRYIILNKTIEGLEGQSRAENNDKNCRLRATYILALYNKYKNYFFLADKHLDKEHICRRDTGVFITKVLLVLNPNIENLFLIGFDFGAVSGSRKNNVYLGTENYAPVDAKTEEKKPRRQIDEFSKIMEMYPTLNIYRVECYEPKTYTLRFIGNRSIPNIRWVEFMERIGGE